MKNSKFTEAYLSIIKEENEGFNPAVGGEAEGAEMAEQGGEGAQIVCFKTTDKTLIDAINSGFDEVVFFVKAKDEATGEDTVQEVKFGPEAFEELEVKAADEAGTCPECGAEDGECACECGGGAAGGSVEGEDTGDGGGDDGGAVTGDDTGDAMEDTGDAMEDTGDNINEEPETIDPSEWLEDGVCVKCGNPECDGTCKCKKCGSQNCIGDCGGDTEEEGTIGGALGGAGGAVAGTLLGGPIGGAIGAAVGGGVGGSL